MLDLIRHPSSRLRNRQLSLTAMPNHKIPSPDQVIDIHLPLHPRLADNIHLCHPSRLSSPPSVSNSSCHPPHHHPLPRRRSSFSFKSSVRNFNLIRSSRLCYSSDSAFTDSPPHTTTHSSSSTEHRNHNNINNMNISSPFSVTLGRDLHSIPRQPLPPPSQSTSTNPVTLVRTPSEAVRKILSSNKTLPPHRRLLRSPAPPLPSSNSRPPLPLSTRNFSSAPDLASSRHFAADPKLYPVSSITSPLLPQPPLNNNNNNHTHSPSPIAPNLVHPPPFNPTISIEKPDLNRSRHPLIPTPLSPAPAHSPSPDIASYQAWVARNSSTFSPPTSELPPGTAITTLETRPDTSSSASPQSSPERQASKSSKNLSATSSSLLNRPRLKPLFTPHIEMGKAPAAVMRRKPFFAPGALSPHPPSVSPLSPTLVVPNKHPTHNHFMARLLAPLKPTAPPPTILLLNVGGTVFMTAIENVTSRPSFLADFIARQLVTWSRLSLDAVGTGDGVRLVRSWKTGNELASTHHHHHQHDPTTRTGQGREENRTRERNTPKGLGSPISERCSETDDEATTQPLLLPMVVPLEPSIGSSSWASTKVETHRPEGILQVFLDRDPGPYSTLLKYWRGNKPPSSSLLKSSSSSSCSSILLSSSNSWTGEVEEEAKWLGIQKDEDDHHHHDV